MLFNLNRKKPTAFFAAAVMSLSLLVGGCGDDSAPQGGQAAQVKAMNALKRDTPLISEYAGTVVGKNEVKVQSKVSGNVVEKYVSGGQFVTAGQPLYKIDSRNYESAVLQAQANLAQSIANYNNAQTDLARYQELLKADAISEQTVANQSAQVDSYDALCAANAALLRTARQNLDDTVVYSPMTGQLSVDDVAVGTFATAGVTNLVTVGSSDPIYVQFSIAENEYLRFMNAAQGKQNNAPIAVTITLSDGTEYPYVGQIVESDRALADSTGTLTTKALFANPEGMLLPGMFARVKLSGRSVPNAVLVPQRAVQQLLGKSFVMVVGKDNKSESRTVTLGDQVGSYYIIESGIKPEDIVIVEGLSNLQEGRDLNVTMVSAEEMGFKLETDRTIFVGNDTPIAAQ